MVDAVLIQQPAINFTTFLGLTHEAMGYSPAAQVDSCRRELHDAEKFLSCLEALHDPKAAPGLKPHLLTHVSFSAMIAADERDILEILECAAGLPFVSAETRARGITLAVVTGTLAQWRDAVITGSRKSGNVQVCYCKIMSLFEAAGLNVWAECVKRQTANPRIFYLEDKR